MIKIALTFIDGTSQDQLSIWLHAKGAELLVKAAEAERDEALHRFARLAWENDPVLSDGEMKRARDLTNFLTLFAEFQAKTNHNKVKIESYDAKMEVPVEPES